MSAPEQDDLDIQIARSGKARLSPTPSPPSTNSGVVILSPDHGGRDLSVSPASQSSFPYPTPSPTGAGVTSGLEQSRSPNSGGLMRGGIAPINVSRVGLSVSNSELRNRASPIGRPATTYHQHQAPTNNQQFGLQSRGHMSGGGATPLREDTLHARKHSDPSMRPGGANYPGAVGSALLGSSRRRGLLVPLLCFVGGMILMYIVLSSSMLPVSEGGLMGFTEMRATIPASALTAGALLARGKTPEQVEAELRESLPICDAHNYGDGEWVYDASITRAPYVSHEWDNVCDADRETDPVTGQVKSIREELKWVWRPKHCRLVPYSRESFCELLAGRNILFAGDSIAGQHHSSFVHLMSPDSLKDKLWVRDEYFRNDLVTVCQDFYPVPDGATSTPAGKDPRSGRPLPGVRAGFRRNNFLSLHGNTNTTEDHRKWNTNQAWIGEVGAALATPEGTVGPAYDIIVINTGIWMVDAPVYAAMLRDVAAALEKEYPHVTMLWRSTQPGHANCHTHWARPQTRLYSIADTTGGSARFRWEEASERNRIAQAQFPLNYFDVWNLTVLRPDGHMPGECLHYCQPGPVDEWHKLLYHRLAIMNPAFVRKVLTREAEQRRTAVVQAELVEHRQQEEQKKMQQMQQQQAQVIVPPLNPGAATESTPAAEEPATPAAPTPDATKSTPDATKSTPDSAQSASAPKAEQANAPSPPATPEPVPSAPAAPAAAAASDPAPAAPAQEQPPTPAPSAPATPSN